MPFVGCTYASYRRRRRLAQAQSAKTLPLTCLVPLPAHPSYQLVALTLTTNGDTHTWEKQVRFPR